MYRYELHQHTCRCSACGHLEPAEAIRLLRKAGFAGMVLTEHFYHGNTAIRRNVPWPDFVAAYEAAWQEAKAIGAKLDFDVLFGLEEEVGDGKEVLIYGITPQVLYQHPELREGGTPEERLARLAGVVHAAGGLLYQAHPFRATSRLATPREPLSGVCVDGIEVYNASNNAFADAQAERYARRTGVAVIAGSDCHTDDLSARYGITVEHRLPDEGALAAVLRDEDYDLYLPDDL